MTNLNMKTLMRIQRIIAAIILICFTASNTSFAQEFQKSIPLNRETQAVDLAKILSALEIPKELGNIQESFLPTQSKDQFVIYIQDAHSNYDSELNISKLIQFFQEKYELPLVLLEGGEGRLDHLFFKSFPDEKIKAKIADDYLKQGDLQGSEAAAILSDDFKTNFYGVESQALYEQNKKAFLDAFQHEAEILKMLDSEHAKLNQEAKDILSAESLAFLNQSQAFQSEKINLLEYLKVLVSLLSLGGLAAQQPGRSNLETEIASASFGTLLRNDGEDKTSPPQDDKAGLAVNYPNLHKILVAEENGKAEQGSDFDIAMNQLVKTFQSEIFSTSSKELKLEMGAMIQDFQTGKIDRGFLVKRIEELSGNSISIPEVLKSTARQAETLSSIKGTKIFDELRQLEDFLRKALPKSGEEKEILERYKQLELLTSFAKLELTHDEWSKLKPLSSPNAFTLAPVREALFGKNLRFFSESVGDLESWIPAFAGMTNSLLSHYFAPHIHFYELALKRDDALFQNSLKVMDKTKSKLTLIVTGGFHEEGIKQKLKDENIPFVLITPKITQIGSKENYLNAMHEKRSFMKYYTTSLWDALAQDYSEKVTEFAGTTGRSPLLKHWHDQIILNTVQEGRVTQAASYTKYVDALVRASKASSTNGNPAGDEAKLRENVAHELDSFFSTYFDKLKAQLDQRLNIFSDGLKTVWAKQDFSAQAVQRLVNQVNLISKSNIAIPVAMIPGARLEIRNHVKELQPGIRINRGFDNSLDYTGGREIHEALHWGDEFPSIGEMKNASVSHLEILLKQVNKKLESLRDLTLRGPSSAPANRQYLHNYKFKMQLIKRIKRKKKIESRIKQKQRNSKRQPTQASSRPEVRSGSDNSDRQFKKIVNELGRKFTQKIKVLIVEDVPKHITDLKDGLEYIGFASKNIHVARDISQFRLAIKSNPNIFHIIFLDDNLPNDFESDGDSAYFNSGSATEVLQELQEKNILPKRKDHKGPIIIHCSNANFNSTAFETTHLVLGHKAGKSILDIALAISLLVREQFPELIGSAQGGQNSFISMLNSNGINGIQENPKVLVPILKIFIRQYPDRLTNFDLLGLFGVSNGVINQIKSAEIQNYSNLFDAFQRNSLSLNSTELENLGITLTQISPEQITDFKFFFGLNSQIKDKAGEAVISILKNEFKNYARLFEYWKYYYIPPKQPELTTPFAHLLTTNTVEHISAEIAAEQNLYLIEVLKRLSGSGTNNGANLSTTTGNVSLTNQPHSEARVSGANQFRDRLPNTSATSAETPRAKKMRFPIQGIKEGDSAGVYLSSEEFDVWSNVTGTWWNHPPVELNSLELQWLQNPQLWLQGQSAVSFPKVDLVEWDIRRLAINNDPNGNAWRVTEFDPRTNRKSEIDVPAGEFYDVHDYFERRVKIELREIPIVVKQVLKWRQTAVQQFLQIAQTNRGLWHIYANESGKVEWAGQINRLDTVRAMIASGILALIDGNLYLVGETQTEFQKQLSRPEMRGGTDLVDAYARYSWRSNVVMAIITFVLIASLIGGIFYGVNHKNVWWNHYQGTRAKTYDSGLDEKFLRWLNNLNDDGRLEFNPVGDVFFGNHSWSDFSEYLKNTHQSNASPNTQENDDRMISHPEPRNELRSSRSEMRSGNSAVIYSMIESLPLKSLADFWARNISSWFTTLTTVGRKTLTTRIPSVGSGGYLLESEKSLSWVMSALFLAWASLYTAPFLRPLGIGTISWPMFLSAFTIFLWSISSASSRSEISGSTTLESFSLVNQFSSVMETGLKRFFSERGISFQNIINRLTAFNHSQNKGHRNTSSLETRFSVANFWVNVNKFLGRIFSHAAENSTRPEGRQGDAFTRSEMRNIQGSMNENGVIVNRSFNYGHLDIWGGNSLHYTLHHESPLPSIESLQNADIDTLNKLLIQLNQKEKQLKTGVNGQINLNKLSLKFFEYRSELEELIAADANRSEVRSEKSNPVQPSRGTEQISSSHVFVGNLGEFKTIVETPLQNLWRTTNELKTTFKSSASPIFSHLNDLSSAIARVLAEGVDGDRMNGNDFLVFIEEIDNMLMSILQEQTQIENAPAPLQLDQLIDRMIEVKRVVRNFKIVKPNKIMVTRVWKSKHDNPMTFGFLWHFNFTTPSGEGYQVELVRYNGWEFRVSKDYRHVKPGRALEQNYEIKDGKLIDRFGQDETQKMKDVLAALAEHPVGLFLIGQHVVGSLYPPEIRERAKFIAAPNWSDNERQAYALAVASEAFQTLSDSTVQQIKQQPGGVRDLMKSGRDAAYALFNVIQSKKGFLPDFSQKEVDSILDEINRLAKGKEVRDAEIQTIKVTSGPDTEIKKGRMIRTEFTFKNGHTETYEIYSDGTIRKMDGVLSFTEALAKAFANIGKSGSDVTLIDLGKNIALGGHPVIFQQLENQTDIWFDLFSFAPDWKGFLEYSEVPDTWKLAIQKGLPRSEMRRGDNVGGEIISELQRDLNQAAKTVTREILSGEVKPESVQKIVDVIARVPKDQAKPLVGVISQKIAQEANQEFRNQVNAVKASNSDLSGKVVTIATGQTESLTGKIQNILDFLSKRLKEDKLSTSSLSDQDAVYFAQSVMRGVQVIQEVPQISVSPLSIEIDSIANNPARMEQSKNLVNHVTNISETTVVEFHLQNEILNDPEQLNDLVEMALTLGTISSQKIYVHFVVEGADRATNLVHLVTKTSDAIGSRLHARDNVQVFVEGSEALTGSRQSEQFKSRIIVASHPNDFAVLKVRKLDSGSYHNGSSVTIGEKVSAWRLLFSALSLDTTEAKSATYTDTVSNTTQFNSEDAFLGVFGEILKALALQARAEQRTQMSA